MRMHSTPIGGSDGRVIVNINLLLGNVAWLAVGECAHLERGQLDEFADAGPHVAVALVLLLRLFQHRRLPLRARLRRRQRLRANTPVTTPPDPSL